MEPSPSPGWPAAARRRLRLLRCGQHALRLDEQRRDFRVRAADARFQFDHGALDVRRAQVVEEIEAQVAITLLGASWTVTMLLALHTPAMLAAVRMMASLKAGSARSPISSSLDSRASNAATAARMTAIAKEATPSQRESPPDRGAGAGRGGQMPRIAAESSNTTMKVGGSLERRNASHQPRCAWRRERRACRPARRRPRTPARRPAPRI
jgi:hypothetical protein